MNPICLLLLLLTPYIYGQQRYDVVIEEFMADPSPGIGLPNHEWIELKNISGSPINLQNWRITDESGQSGPMPGYQLQPDSLVIICATSSANALSGFGTTLTIGSFPSLDNDGDHLVLKNSAGNVIHGIIYDLSWYDNELKKEGGWSLEMIDPTNPCGGPENWKASIHSSGGSPGKKNSVDNIYNDSSPPVLLRTYTIDDSTIIAVFNEPVDSSTGSIKTHYSLNNGLLITQSILLPPVFNMARLRINDSMRQGIIYELSITNIMDCKNNTINAGSKVHAGLPESVNVQEMIINEILFNPRSSGEDYIELYNRSRKIVDAANLNLANLNNSNVLSNIRQLTSSPFLIFPGTYVVATADDVGLKREYLVSHPEFVFRISSPPSMPDDRGHIVLLNQQGTLIDELKYDHTWHFKLLSNEEGVALERIDPDISTNEPSNWHSAASSAGYGTPTYRNSQYKLLAANSAMIKVSPRILSPDNDGYDDVATIQYKMTEPGYVANINIFDMAGRLVKALVRNALLGIEGYWHWDGLGQNNERLALGPYVMVTELFNLKGKVEKNRNVIFLARKL